MKTTFVKREIDSVPQNAGYSWLERIVVDYPFICVEVYACRLHAFTAFQTLVVKKVAVKDAALTHLSRSLFWSRTAEVWKNGTVYMGSRLVIPFH